MQNPSPFNESDIHKYIVAPYLSDIDTRSTGSVSFEIYSNTTNLPLLQSVSNFIQQKVHNRFTGTWMLVAEWNGVVDSGKIKYLHQLAKILGPILGSKYGDLRLVRGTVSDRRFSSGRLEIFINGEWGTICDDYFDLTDAHVACKQLGYSGAVRYGRSGNEGYMIIFV